MIKQATIEMAPAIADLIIMAMTEECCLHFCDAHHGISDFRQMMTRLVSRDDSQYSYLNTLVALQSDRVVGISVSYDGARLHTLRRAFIEEAKKYLGRDHEGMDDETQAGELYLDSLAVLPEYRRQGIATRLLAATCARAAELHLPHLGLLVDQSNPAGASLYHSFGFTYANDTTWGGHPMSHLTIETPLR